MIELAPPPLLLERREAALWLTLNRPDAFNALDADIVAALAAACDRVERERDIRLVVVTGNGKAFCAGADLKGVLSETDSAVDQAQALAAFLTRTGKVFDRLERLGVPTIAVVNGVALAGGLELILCCDFAIAVDTATIGEGHAKFAQLPGAGGSVRLPRRIGAARAKYMMFTGDLLTAEQALAWGLVDFVVPAAGLDALLEATSRRIADKSALVLARMKSLVLDGQEQPKDVALRAEIAMGASHTASYDRNEGLAAFVEKRKPAYRGC